MSTRKPDANPHASALGSIKSERKAAASRENGKKGGYPKGRPRKKETDMTTKPSGLIVGAGIPNGDRVNTFIECGCCGQFHRTDFRGDCRENSERFSDIPDDGIEVFADET